MELNLSLGIGPLTGARRKKVLKLAIEGLDLPWLCADKIKVEAKKVAIHAASNGLIPSGFIKELVPSVFKTQRDAKHAMVMLSAVDLAAVTYEDWRVIGIVEYEWQWIPGICSFPEHELRHWKRFSVADGDLPSTKYGCRCHGRAVFDDL